MSILVTCWREASPKVLALLEDLKLAKAKGLSNILVEGDLAIVMS